MLQLSNQLKGAMFLATLMFTTIISAQNNYPPTGNIRVENKLIHTADSDNFIHFRNDRLNITVGGVPMMEARELNSQDYINFGNGSDLSLIHI